MRTEEILPRPPQLPSSFTLAVMGPGLEWMEGKSQVLSKEIWLACRGSTVTQSTFLALNQPQIAYLL